jgi:hypothetical protein
MAVSVAAVGLSTAAPGRESPQPMHEQATLAFDDKYEVRVNVFLRAENNHLFNEPNYFRLHATSSNDIYAQLVRISDSRVYATIAFYEDEGKVFASPKRGTFGGLGLNQPLDLQIVERFIRTIVAFLKSLGGRKISLKCPPMSHDLALSSVVSNICLRHGATLCGYELNYDLRVDSRPFLERIDYSNVKRIRKCLRTGFLAEEIPMANYAAAYSVVRENREQHGYPISMTEAQLEAMLATFPDRLHFFAVFPEPQKSRIVAAAVCVALTPTILYVLYWGDVADMAAFSPIALLASCIYAFCQREGFVVLDVGTSTLHGEPNTGLINFKRNLGCSESLKLSFCYPA